MRTVVYLSNLEVRAAVGKTKGDRVIVKSVCSAKAPEGSIINGMVTNEEAFYEFLKKFWADNRLAKKHVTLVLGSAQAMERVVTVPKMSHKKIMEYLPREFASVDRTRDPVYSYEIVEEEKKTKKLLSNMVDRGFLKSHVDHLKAMGIRLESILLGSTAEILLLNRMPCLEEETFVYQILDGMSVLNILYVNGEFFQMTRNRVFGARGTASFGVECARTISSQQQFLRTQSEQSRITHVYLGGEFQEEDFETVSDSLLQMDPMLEVDWLTEDPESEIEFQPESGEGRYCQYAALTGAFLTPLGKNNFYAQYVRDPQLLEKRRQWRKALIPVTVVVGVMGATAVGLMIWQLRQERVLEQQFEYMSNVAIIKQVMEYDQLKAENDILAVRSEAIGWTEDSMDTYPAWSSAVKRAVTECAAGLTDVQVDGFELNSGVVSLTAEAPLAENVNQFVQRLKDRSDIFDSMSYSGFEYDESRQCWRAGVNAYLCRVEVADAEVSEEELP